MLVVERFRKDEATIEEVDARERGRGEEGIARVDLAEGAANGGAEDEAEAEGGPEHTVGLAALVRFGRVGNVGGGGGVRRAGNSGEEAAEEEKPDGMGEAHDHEVDREHA